ncbi:hypothetical protein GCM10023166_33940 [Paeniglutamicibacter cryotolerans]
MEAGLACENPHNHPPKGKDPTSQQAADRTGYRQRQHHDHRVREVAAAKRMRKCCNDRGKGRPGPAPGNAGSA